MCTVGHWLLQNQLHVWSPHMWRTRKARVKMQELSLASFLRLNDPEVSFKVCLTSLDETKSPTCTDASLQKWWLFEEAADPKWRKGWVGVCGGEWGHGSRTNRSVAAEVAPTWESRAAIGPRRRACPRAVIGCSRCGLLVPGSSVCVVARAAEERVRARAVFHRRTTFSLQKRRGAWKKRHPESPEDPAAAAGSNARFLRTCPRAATRPANRGASDVSAGRSRRSSPPRVTDSPEEEEEEEEKKETRRRTFFFLQLPSRGY